MRYFGEGIEFFQDLVLIAQKIALGSQILAHQREK